MSSFMNQYYYGKAGKGDFTEDQLPTNRLQLFFTTLRLHIGGLMGMNLMYIVFAFPLIIWTMLHFSLVYASVGDPSLEAWIQGYMNMYAIGLVPCFALVGVGMSGIGYVLRNWARDQHTFTISDFKDSLKTNWKQGLLGGLETGVALMAAWYSFVFYGQLANRSVLFIVPQAMAIALCAVLLMSSMLFYPMMVTYDLKFRHVLLNSVLITMRRLPLSILAFALPIGIPIAVLWLFGGNMYVMAGVTFLYLIVGFSLTNFIQIAYANACLEKYLNPLIEGAETNIGMRDKSEDDLDDEDEEEEQKDE